MGHEGRILKAFEKLVGNLKITELFKSERPKTRYLKQKSSHSESRWSTRCRTSEGFRHFLDPGRIRTAVPGPRFHFSPLGPILIIFKRMNAGDTAS